jgi:hypothetical protein
MNAFIDVLALSVVIAIIGRVRALMAHSLADRRKNRDMSALRHSGCIARTFLPSLWRSTHPNELHFGSTAVDVRGQKRRFPDIYAFRLPSLDARKQDKPTE